MSNKNIIGSCIGVIIILIFLIIIFSIIFFPFAMFGYTDWKVKHEFDQNKEEMERVANFLLLMNFEDCHIDNDNLNEFIQENDVDDTIKGDFKLLLEEEEFLYIELYNAKKTVFFCQDSKLWNGIGMAYVTDGNKPKIKEYKLCYEHYDGNWYFCSTED